MNFNLITCIVEQGKAEAIIDEVVRRGAQAATYYPAKGKGVREKIGVAGVFIKEDKEVIMIVTKPDQTQFIFDTVVTMAGLKEEGRGFVFVQKVDNAVGFL